ncbi:MAG: UvrD-helicase domain-containing protein, partial [Bdellovibrionales bacterium]|nr:UvrD-helicase domain-containing protein [Bdellovibrionales bacterium]
WLLHKDNSDVRADKAIVIVQSNALRSFIKDTLPSIDVHGVQIFTYSEWVFQIVNRVLSRDRNSGNKFELFQGVVSASIERIKGSVAVLQTIEHRAKRDVEEILNRLSTVAWESLPSGLGQLFERFRAGALKSPKSAKPVRFLREIQSGIGKLRATLSPSHPKAGELVAVDTLVSELLNSQQNYKSELLTILGDSTAILEADETHLLDRALIDSAYNQTLSNVEHNIIDIHDAALILRLIELKEGALPGSDGRPYLYDHIVIDEVQDLSVVQLAAAVCGVESSANLTIVGDTAQQANPNSTFPGWEKLERYWDEQESISRFISLRISHRSTLQIMKLGDHILGEDRTDSGRDGRAPIWFHCRNES